jgi:hypothetical protein
VYFELVGAVSSHVSLGMVVFMLVWHVPKLTKNIIFHFFKKTGANNSSRITKNCQ